jgi:hypothetical protein
MSSTIWTPAALLSDAGPSSGSCWRLVEAQHRVSTAKLTDTMAEQERLELLIEDAKPNVPEECHHLHYLLFTPFRYGTPYPNGSRFRRAGLTPGIFYGSETPETAATEIAFHRLLFFAESPATPWPTMVSQFTAFCVEAIAGRTIDLSLRPLRAARSLWVHPTDYSACQQLCDNARSAAIDVIKYESVRDPRGGKNIAILSCRAFGAFEPTNPQTWRMHLNAAGIRLFREFPRFAVAFDRATFAADPRIASMVWDR